MNKEFEALRESIVADRAEYYKEQQALKSTAAARLLYEGKIQYADEVLELLKTNYPDPADTIRAKLDFTKRHMAIIEGVAAGKKNKEIAQDLGTLEESIETMKYRIFKKCGVHSSAALVDWAYKNRILKL